ncbi:MAG: outer membrane lipoprotein-sorting protein [Deltaproteobacteria bacterium]|nr:outer membrane lipoprotein-sorting protein [Deltaproteobacteria bacterium]
MTRCRLSIVLLTGFLLFSTTARAGGTPTAREIIDKVMDADPWGLAGAEVKARAIVRDSKGATRELSFLGRSKRHAPPLSKSVVRILGPADLAGTSFLQVQKSDGDDERWLYLPDLKRARRIAGNARKNAFMGTDFSYADIDRRDLRDSAATIAGEEKIGKYDCWHLVAKPSAQDAQYGRIEIWVRKDNFVPLKWTMHGRSGVHLKTLLAEELKRIEGRWFVTRSTMQNHQDERSTALYLDEIKPLASVADDEFTVRNLEKN